MQYPFGSWGILIEIWMQGILSLLPSLPCTNAWTDSNWEYDNRRTTLVGHPPCPKVTQANFRKRVCSSSSGNAVLLNKLHKTLKWNHRIHLYKITQFYGIIFILVFRTPYFFEIITTQRDGMVKVTFLYIPENSAQRQADEISKFVWKKMLLLA